MIARFTSRHANTLINVDASLILQQWQIVGTAVVDIAVLNSLLI